MDLILAIGFVAACFFAYFLIGDLFHRLPGARNDPEGALRRKRPLHPQDEPSWRFNIDGAGNSFADEDPQHLND